MEISERIEKYLIESANHYLYEKSNGNDNEENIINILKKRKWRYVNVVAKETKDPGSVWIKNNIRVVIIPSKKIVVFTGTSIQYGNEDFDRKTFDFSEINKIKKFLTKVDKLIENL